MNNALDKLLTIGQQMSNLCYNLSQDQNNPHSETMDELRKEWDELRKEWDTALGGALSNRDQPMSMLKIAPGTQVLNQSIEHPMSGEVIPTPEGEVDMTDHVWVQWCDRSVGNDGVIQEYLADLTLTGKVFVAADQVTRRRPARPN